MCFLNCKSYISVHVTQFISPQATAEEELVGHILEPGSPPGAPHALRHAFTWRWRAECHDVSPTSQLLTGADVSVESLSGIYKLDTFCSIRGGATHSLNPQAGVRRPGGHWSDQQELCFQLSVACSGQISRNTSVIIVVGGFMRNQNNKAGMTWNTLPPPNSFKHGPPGLGWCDSEKLLEHIWFLFIFISSVREEKPGKPGKP